MDIIEFARDTYTVSTDPARLDSGVIYDFLVNRSYWASERSFQTVQRSMQNSFCFGPYHTNLGSIRGRMLITSSGEVLLADPDGKVRLIK